MVLLQFVVADGDEQELLLGLGDDANKRELGAVDYVYAETEPGEVKADVGLIEWVGVTLVAAHTLRDVVLLAVEWSQRAKRPVRVRLGDDEMLLDDTSTDQRDAIIEGFLGRHRADGDAD